jgi:hypothetical protein
MFVSCTVFVLSGRGLCDGPIPCPEESYRLWCVFECDQAKINSLHPYFEQVGRKGRTAKRKETETLTEDNAAFAGLLPSSTQLKNRSVSEETSSVLG